MKKFYWKSIAFVVLLLTTISLSAQVFTPVHTGLITSFGTWTHINTVQRTGDPTQGDCINLVTAAGAAGSVTTPVMNFTTCGSTPYITFKFSRLGNSSTRAQIGVDVSTNGGGTWTNVGNFQPTSTSWFYATPINLSAYSGSANVLIRLSANNGPTSIRYPIIDDIHIYCATPPANDECATATTIVEGAIGVCTPTAGTVNYATQSAPASTCGGTANNDVWYKFVATAANTTISVTGNANMDAVVQLLSGACGALSSLQCQDATFSGGTEQFTYSGLTVGNTYYVRVYDYYGAPPIDGSFTICVYEAAASASSCANPTPIPCGGSLVGQTNAGAVNNTNSWGCHIDGLGIPITTDGEDVYYAVTTTSSGYIRLTLDNVTASGTTYLELIGLGTPCVSGACVRSTQMVVSTGLFSSNGLNSWDYDVPGAGTYYFVVDAQGSGSILNWDISVNCYATGIRIDTTNNCGAAFGTGDNNQGVYTTWNGAQAPASYDASLGGTFTVCESIYLRNTGWEWLKTYDLSVGSCWMNIRNVTPTGNNFCFHAVNNVSCPTVGWSGAIAGNTINWTFLHPYRYTTPPPTCTDVTAWGDGSLIPPPYTCALYTFCYTADVDPTCVDVSGLQNTISATDDGIGGGGGTMASNVLMTYPWSINGSTLPVSLLSFRSACQQGITTLYWSTASETNNDYFTLERSFDGKHFDFLFQAQGAGNSNDIHAYTVTDEQYDDVVYYRLSQTDFDGSTHVLKTIASSCNSANKMKPIVMNNCTDGFMQIQFNSIVATNYFLTVIDASGRVVYQQSMSASETTSSFIIPVDAWAKGVYSFILKDGMNTVTDKFFIE
ncbi:MAG: hypothetical protein CVU11_07480 [Bacteroidetes bacterium HGW-Bacteroidetes-6]|jgi:hypothetical protein|nr:MAG: hypothetical protein CVU11_07480 [Bacteroidetes bacterium HGW-Bacteroidetes-6]